jgi:hypothetical protein
MALIKIQRFFGAVPNDLLNNPDISFKAKGLYAYLNSKPDNWDFSVEGIAAQVKEGIDSVRAGIHELEKFGYLKRIKHQDEKGYWDVDYMLFEVPVEHESYLGKSNEGKHPKQYKKDYTKKEYTKKEIYKEKNPLPLFPTNQGNEKKDEHSRGGGGPAAVDYKGMDEAAKLWLEYKAERKQKYSGPKSIQIMINQLYKKANGSAERAMAIVENSIANNYQGLFEARENNTMAQQPTMQTAKHNLQFNFTK